MFYDFIIYSTRKETTEDELIIEHVKYIKADEFLGDIQPSEEKFVKAKWGESASCDLVLYSNKSLAIDDRLIFNSELFKVKYKKDWFDYKVYGLVGVEDEFLQ